MHALLYAQDPGGANILARIAQRMTRPDRLTVVVHPLAASAFDRLDVPAEPVGRWLPTLPASCEDIDRWLDDEAVTRVVCTTSSRQVDLTNGRLIERANARKIPTLGFLDHWVGFDRFVDEQGTPRYLPDVVGCPDRFCQEELIALGLSRERAPIVGHAHLEAVAAAVPSFQARDGGATRVLLVSQPDVVAGTFRGVFFLPWGSGRIIDAVIATLRPLVDAGAIAISYRPHPKESPADTLPPDIQFDRGPAGSALLWRHDVFVGVTSMVLFEAAIARRFVVQLDLPVLRETVSGDWPPYSVGKRLATLGDLRKTVESFGGQIRAGESGPGVEGLALAGSLDRSIALVEAFVSASDGASAVSAAATETR